MTTRACTDEGIDGPPSPLPNNSCLGDHTNLPSPDVSRRLPAELLASVFIRIARNTYNHSMYNHCTRKKPGWVNFSYVCHYWRDVALNCPTLWSYIPVTTRRWTKELLARSKMAPLKLSMTEYSILSHSDSQRIQELHLCFDTISPHESYQILSKFLFSRLPCLQHLDMSYFKLPAEKSWLLFKEITPALRTLRLLCCSLPWYSLGPSTLTTLLLYNIEAHENTMATFLAVLRRMPLLMQLSVQYSLPSARNFLSNGEFDATPIISLPYLCNMSIAKAPLSAAIALLSCVDIPSKTKVLLEIRPEDTSAYVTTLDDYVRLASLLGQRVSQSKFRSLTISPRSTALVFSMSERVECRSPDSLSHVRLDDDTLLKVIFVSFSRYMDGLDYPILSSICNAIPLTNIQSVHLLSMPLSLEFWRDTLALFSDVRHIRVSGYMMPYITSMLSLPSHHLTRSWQYGRADGGQGEIFVPALEELELYGVILKTVHGTSDPDPSAVDVQALYDAIATRKETRCQLTLKGCRLKTDRGLKFLSSVGWWEDDQFRVTYV